MEIGSRFAGESFRDVLGNCTEPVTVDGDGWADFRTEGRNVAIWVREGAFEDLVVNE
jgi:alpha-amylase